MSDNEVPQLHVYYARAALAEYLRGLSRWRHVKAEEWPDDTRNAQSGEALGELADFVMRLPASDERLQRLAAYHVEGFDVFLEGERSGRLASRYGFGSAANPDEFIEEFLHLLSVEDHDTTEDTEG